MYYRYFILLLPLIITSLCGCHLNLNNHDGQNGNIEPDTTIFKNVTSSNLPSGLADNTVRAKAADLDNDGDIDIVLAIEFQANKILINDGTGIFLDQSSSRLPAQQFDTRDVAVADFDRDQNPDLLFINNQNQNNELYINQGRGTFTDLSIRIPVNGNFTAGEAADIDGDGNVDIMIGNNGQNIILINNGNVIFTNETADRLPQRFDNTNDIAFGDITGDGRTDIIVANADNNSVFVNTGSGFFVDQTASRIPFINKIEETRDVNLSDIDGDHDLDLYFGNSGFQSGSNPKDRILLNNGNGIFSDKTGDRLPAITSDTFDADFADIDKDGDPDLLVGNYHGGIHVLINNGSGFFTDQSPLWISNNFLPEVSDLEIADYNDDGLLDVYIAVHGGSDQLLFQKK